MTATVNIAELSPENLAEPQGSTATIATELLEQVPEVEARIVEEMTAKVFVPVREITEISRGAIRKVIEENAALFTRARLVFAAQGRRVPVEGKPTWNEWLKQNLPCSDRYVRKVLADIGEEGFERWTPELQSDKSIEPQTYALPENWHPAANAFALLPDDSEAFRALVSDIKEHGLNNPIALYQGKVLDGRNRIRACLAAGVTPSFYEWRPQEDQTPETWSASQNLYRRHLNTSQQQVGKDELRGYTIFKNLRNEYVGFEEEYAKGWEKVKHGEQSLATFVREMDWFKSGGKIEETPLSVSGAAQTFLRFLSYETAFPIYRTRQEQLREGHRTIFDEAWAIVREGIYGFTSDL